MDSETISQSSNSASLHKMSSKKLFIVQSSEEVILININFIFYRKFQDADNDLIIRDETTRKYYINNNNFFRKRNISLSI